MADILDIIVIPTYNKQILGILDNSTYAIAPTSASLEVTVPGFDPVDVAFTPSAYNTYMSTDLGLVDPTADEVALSDGVYKLVLSVTPETTDAITRYIMRVDQIQEKFDAAFMKLDMMECDRAIKKQAKVDLNTISFFIQGAISAANNCATTEANKLYLKADSMLNSFIRNNCGCSGTNYLTNFS